MKNDSENALFLKVNSSRFFDNKEFLQPLWTFKQSLTSKFSFSFWSQCIRTSFQNFFKKYNNVKCFSHYVEHKIHNLWSGLLLLSIYQPVITTINHVVSSLHGFCIIKNNSIWTRCPDESIQFKFSWKTFVIYDPQFIGGDADEIQELINVPCSLQFKRKTF
jgi:hypothetical protein